MTSPPILELRGLEKDFSGVKALADVSLQVGQAEIHCLAGENGSGKSTLIKIVSGIYQPDRGEIRINGELAREMTPIEAIRRGVQVIYQDFSLFGNLTVAENLMLSSDLAAGRRVVNWSRTRRLAREAINRMNVDLSLDSLVESLPTSGKQLVAIARALISDARLLIMDEPTAALTNHEVETLFRTVRELQRQGLSVLFVSHKMREMLEISERLTVIRNGKKVASGDIRDFDEIAITRAMTGQDISGRRYSWAKGATEAPRLEIEGLSVDGEFADISLVCQPGEIVGLAGLLGSGRTELALTLFGMRPGYRGAIRIDGKDVRIASVKEAMAYGVAYVPEDRLSEGLFLERAIDDNILANSYGDFTEYGLINFRRSARAASGMRQRMRIAAPDGNRPVRVLSGGNQQRVVIGRWLMREARVLILNGPTVGVDVGSKAGIHQTVRELAVNRRTSVLMISDDLPELAQNCNRILIMHRGELRAEFEGASVDEALIAERMKSLQ